MSFQGRFAKAEPVLVPILRKRKGHKSTADFVSKIKIALKEANETQYWLRLLHETKYITDKAYVSLHGDLVEILKILTAICKHYPQNNL